MGIPINHSKRPRPIVSSYSLVPSLNGGAELKFQSLPRTALSIVALSLPDFAGLMGVAHMEHGQWTPSVGLLGPTQGT